MNNLQLTNQEEIEYLYKDVNYPAMKVEHGFGEYGVVVRNKVDDTLQCHECGEFFSHLGSHVWHSHGMLARGYKIKYGLKLGTPLCNKEISKVHSIVSKKNNESEKMDGEQRYIKKLMKLKNGNSELSKEKRAKASWRGGNSMQAKNERNLCPKQIEARYRIVCIQTNNNDPSQREIRIYDSKLANIIQYKYGSFNKFRKVMGHKKIKLSGQTIYDKEKIIAFLRSYKIKNKKVPSYDKCKYTKPTAGTIVSYFGSWNKALISAGLK